MSGTEKKAVETGICTAPAIRVWETAVKSNVELRTVQSSHHENELRRNSRSCDMDGLQTCDTQIMVNTYDYERMGERHDGIIEKEKDN